MAAADQNAWSPVHNKLRLLKSLIFAQTEHDCFGNVPTSNFALLHYKRSTLLASILDASCFIAKVFRVSGKGSGSVYTREYQLFLQQLVAARTQSGLSQRALAEKLGKSYSYIAKCETGYVRMDIYQIRQYLNAVGTPFLEFMARYEEAVMGVERH